MKKAIKVAEEIRGALARGYCTKRNEHKILDPDLIEDMAIEIEKAQIKARPSVETIRKAIQEACIGSVISCKNPQKLTIDEVKNAFKIFEVKVASDIVALWEGK